MQPTKRAKELRATYSKCKKCGTTENYHVLRFLQGHPKIEWVVGMRVICSRKNDDLVSITYLREKLGMLMMPGAYKKVFDKESRAAFTSLMAR